MISLTSIWGQALIGLLIGGVFGITLFPWLASPFSPGLWKLSTPFTRIMLTVGQFIRGNGVLIRTSDGHYAIGTYVSEDEGGPSVQLGDREIPVDPDRIQWGLFGKRPFGLAWEPGTPLHRRVSDGQTHAVEAEEPPSTDDAGGLGELFPQEATDGGKPKLRINMAAVHRFLRGTNESDAIDRTEEHAKAEYGGGGSGFSEKLMAGLVILMLLMGALTSLLAF